MARATKPLLTGVFTALVTPFQSDGAIDFDAFDQLIHDQIENGVNGLVVCGSTGESHALSIDEHIELVSRCVSSAAGRVQIIAGAGSNNTRAACALQRAMNELGISATLQVMPWYNKPSQEGLYRHFRQIAESSDLPLLLYNVPYRTGVDILPDTIMRLARDCPTIVGIKESNVELLRLQSILAALSHERPDFCLLSGEDACVLPLLAMGGHGVISVSSNFAPREMVALVRAFHDLDFGTARAVANRFASLISLMFFRTNPLPIKTALHLKGKIHNCFRLPLCPLSDDDTMVLQKGLRDGGWL